MLQSLSADIAAVMPLARASGLGVSLCTIQAPDGAISPDGTPGNGFTTIYANVTCQDAPPSMARIQATEVKDVAEMLAKGMRHVLLYQCFLDAPNWAGKGYRAVVDGIAYDLLGAENDSQSTQTRIDLQLVTV